MSKHDETEQMERTLETAGREYGKHSGPDSGERERRTFAHDLHVAALRYARAYYAEARELGLIPEYERAKLPRESQEGWLPSGALRVAELVARFILIEADEIGNGSVSAVLTELARKIRTADWIPADLELSKEDGDA